jgi:hypothetical protein
MALCCLPFSLSRKPTGVLRGHRAPVMYVHVAFEENKVFSMSADNTVKVGSSHGLMHTYIRQAGFVY